MSGNEIQSLGMHPCRARTWISIRRDLGTSARSATDDLPKVAVMPETLYSPSPGFQTLQASLGQPVRLSAKAGVSQMMFW